MSATDTPTSPSSQVTTVLNEQHEQLKELMGQVISSHGKDRQVAFTQVRHLVASHEGAEEEILHRLARTDLGSDDEVVTARLAEEDEAGQAIAKLEQLDIDSEDFSTGFAALQKSIIAHAEAEEHQELPAIAAAINAEQQRAMLTALAQVPELAGSGSLTAHGDSFAAMLQSARDHFRNPPGAATN